MKKISNLSVIALAMVVLVAVLAVGTALAWFYEKDQTPTFVNTAGSEPVTEIIFHAHPTTGVDPVTAILRDTLRFCARDDVSPLVSPFDPLNPSLSCPDPADQTVGVFNGVFTIADFEDPDPDDDLQVQFIPSTLIFSPATWGDVFPPGTTEACITGLVDNDGDQLGDEPLDDIDGLALCQPLKLTGRMTGGGSVFDDNDNKDTGIRITRGFEIHCDTREPNNVQVNEHGNGKLNFHLEDLISARCVDNPNIFQDPPPGTPFDTFIGYGEGRLKDGKVDIGPGFICFVFRDDSEPGKTDIAAILLKTVAFDCDAQVNEVNLNVDWDGVFPTIPPHLLSDPGVGNRVLFVNGSLNGGNVQAHEDNK